MSIEQLLAYHCGPALTGLKPSNLVSCTKYSTRDVIEKNILLNKSCNTYGVYFHPIVRPKGSVLIFVYNKPLLEQTLKNPKAMKILDKEGYTPESSLEDKIKFLEKRINSSPDCTSRSSNRSAYTIFSNTGGLIFLYCVCLRNCSSHSAAKVSSFIIFLDFAFSHKRHYNTLYFRPYLSPICITQ